VGQVGRTFNLRCPSRTVRRANVLAVPTVLNENQNTGIGASWLEETVE